MIKPRTLPAMMTGKTQLGWLQKKERHGSKVKGSPLQVFKAGSQLVVAHETQLGVCGEALHAGVHVEFMQSAAV